MMTNSRLDFDRIRRVIRSTPYQTNLFPQAKCDTLETINDGFEMLLDAQYQLRKTTASKPKPMPMGNHSNRFASPPKDNQSLPQKKLHAPEKPTAEKSTPSNHNSRPVHILLQGKGNKDSITVFLRNSDKGR